MPICLLNIISTINREREYGQVLVLVWSSLHIVKWWSSKISIQCIWLGNQRDLSNFCLVKCDKWISWISAVKDKIKVCHWTFWKYILCNLCNVSYLSFYHIAGLIYLAADTGNKIRSVKFSEKLALVAALPVSSSSITHVDSGSRASETAWIVGYQASVVRVVIGVNTGGGRVPPRIRSGGGRQCYSSPPDFGQLDICCAMNHSAVHRCQASHTAHRLVPAVGWHAL